MSRGFVSLVGAGPGDPGLLTLHGRRALAEADLVLYDYLVHPAVLGHASPGARLVYVGKKGGTSYLPQEEITRKMLDGAGRGLRVVRLKGGDPFLFGRGGEEALACAREGVPFEVVPGVSSAWAAPAYAGMPLTHRGLAAAATVVTGHEDPGKTGGGLSYAALAGLGGTLCFLMGMSTLEEVLGRLRENGLDGSTPAAAVQWGTLPGQRTVTGTVSDLAERCLEADLGAPAVVVVGGVVGLRERLSWFERLPLFGRRVLVTRPREQAGAMSARLRALGAEPVSAPSIRIADTSDPSRLREALARVSDFDFVVFTSRNGVDHFFRHLRELGFDARSLGGVRVAAIGPATAASLEAHGVLADFVPDTYTSVAMVDQLAAATEVAGRRFLLPRADIAPPGLAEALARHGAEVEEVEAYRTVGAELEDGEAEEASGGVDAAVFLSSSSVTRFFEGPLGPRAAGLLEAAAVVSIGPVTSGTLRDRGCDPLEAEEHTVDGVLATLVRHFGEQT